MIYKQRIHAFVQLGEWIAQYFIQQNDILLSAQHHNPWHTIENSKISLTAISNIFLKEEKLLRWLQADKASSKAQKKIGLILAGNIPLVGFHDLLCVLISGHHAVIKMSSKDKILLPKLCEQLIKIEPEFEKQISFVELVKNIDGIIATGSNNSSRYFDYYFRKYPSLLRTHRNSIALLSGQESHHELLKLGNDVFQYFGLGCRNVSFLMFPKGYDVTHLLDVWGNHFEELMNTSPYKNNYDYNRTLLLLNQISHLANDYVMLREHGAIASPVATLHYSFYDTLDSALDFLKIHDASIQCVASHIDLPRVVAFGTTQFPELYDYSDGKNTLDFLASIA